MATLCLALACAGSHDTGACPALLWGEQPEITQQWLALAHMLQQTGHAGELAAPLSLLVDHFGLPAENFLTQMALTASDTQSDVVVHPVKEGRLLNAVSLSLDSLALLTRELVLSVENSVLDNVDLLDIPVAPDSHPHPLWRAKLGWMLAHYRQQVQPDVLVICNALASRSQTSTAARHLLEWVNATQPQHESALPGVVWAITPQDARFATQQNLDEAVQQLMGKPACIGERCRRWINTVCSVWWSGYRRRHRHHSDRRAYRRYANNCEAACAICYRCLMTRGYRLKP